MLKDGTVFDQNPQAGFPVSGVVPGFSEGLKIMQRGGKYRLWIPAELGYGPEDQRNPQTGQVAIPGGSELTFDVELLEFKSRAEIEAMQKQMQEMQQRKISGRNECMDDMADQLRLAQQKGHIRSDVQVTHATIGLFALVGGIKYNWLLDPQAFDLEQVGLATLDTFLAGLRPLATVR